MVYGPVNVCFKTFQGFSFFINSPRKAQIELAVLPLEQDAPAYACINADAASKSVSKLLVLARPKAPIPETKPAKTSPRPVLATLEFTCPICQVLPSGSEITL